jgi:hypothetical protein
VTAEMKTPFILHTSARNVRLSLILAASLLSLVSLAGCPILPPATAVPMCSASFTNASGQVVSFDIREQDTDWERVQINPGRTKEYHHECNTIHFRVKTVYADSDAIAVQYAIPLGKRLVIFWNAEQAPPRWDLRQVEDK